MKQKTYLDKLMENPEFKEKFINELEKIFSDEDYLIWKKQRAIDKNYSSLNKDYLKGYRDCWNKLRDNIVKLIQELKEENNQNENANIQMPTLWQNPL